MVVKKAMIHETVINAQPTLSEVETCSNSQQTTVTVMVVVVGVRVVVAPRQISKLLLVTPPPRLTHATIWAHYPWHGSASGATARVSSVDPPVAHSAYRDRDSRTRINGRRVQVVRHLHGPGDDTVMMLLTRGY